VEFFANAPPLNAESTGKTLNGKQPLEPEKSALESLGGERREK
jgi:hypothetical protein